MNYASILEQIHGDLRPYLVLPLIYALRSFRWRPHATVIRLIQNVAFESYRPKRLRMIGWPRDI